MFSSGLELANLVGSSEVLHRSWDAISGLLQESCSRNDPTTVPLSVAYEVRQYPPSGTIIAFASSPSSTLQHLQTEGTELVSSDELSGFLPVFDFICTKVNPSFSINKSAATIFAALLGGLSLVKQQYGNSNPLIIAGHSMGGSIASLFTLWLLDSISPPAATKHPLCVTFGSPLLGDSSFQKSISERPIWNSCFLHVVSCQDPIPKFFTSSPFHVLSSASSSFQTSYMPFGTFLLCSESDGACFEEPESVLELMGAWGSHLMKNIGNVFQITDYGRTLENLKCRVLCKKESSHLDTSSPFEAGIIMQLEAIGINGVQRENGIRDSFITNVKKRVEKFQLHKRNAFDPTKKLNDIKIDMIYLEWYKKVMIDHGGYYDGFKYKLPKTIDGIRSGEEIVKRKRMLNQYWKNMVIQVEKIPQKESVIFRTRWLYAGTTYRRMIEPLDIAEYYNEGKRDYLTGGRSEHYISLERWFNEDKQPKDETLRKKACSLTEDSCFWAHVEEAIISCKVLKDRESSLEDRELSRNNLITFEHYVMDLIKKHAVSSEIFLQNSTFMRCWEEYYNITGSSYNSSLTDFMKEKYQEYA